MSGPRASWPRCHSSEIRRAPARPASSQAPSASRRSCGRSWRRSSALRLGRRNRCEEALDDLPVRLVVEILLDHFAGACYGQLDRLAPHLGDGVHLLGFDLPARALEHLLLLLVRLFCHLCAHALTDL